jgi:hypothetical protein
VPITRHWALNQLFAGIINLEKPAECTFELLIYVDSIDPRIKNGLEYWVEELAQRDIQADVKYSGRPEPSEVRLDARRQRIVQVHKDIAEIAADYNADYIFGIEDDTIVPPYALARMLSFAQRNPDMGFIEGVQCGRHKYKMIGAWRVNDIHNPTKVTTYPYTPVNRKHSFVESVDGGGFYCYLTPAKLFCEADYRVEGECLGVDMLYGLDLRRKGYKNYIDWSIVCGHSDFGLLIEPGIGRPDVRLYFELVGDEWKMQVFGDER